MRSDSPNDTRKQPDLEAAEDHVAHRDLTLAAASWVPLDRVRPWEKNPRRNDGRPVDEVAASIRRFGFAAPIVARLEDGRIIAGHTRYKAARKLGLERIPVRFLDVTEEQADLLALADNRTGELAEWDLDALGGMLTDVLGQGLDLDGLGWTEAEMKALLAAPEPPATNPDRPEDDEQPVEVPAVAKPGDEYDVGRHRILCGDCLAVLRSMPDASVHAIVCDPPYGIGFMGKDWDASVPGLEWARECLRVLKPGGHLLAFAATRTQHRLAVALEDAGFEIRDVIAWVQWQGFPKSLDVSRVIDERLGVERTVPVGEAYEVPNAQTVNPHFIVAAGRRGDGPETTMHQPMAPASEEAKQWSGWGTALKPSQEPCVLARKPLAGSVAENVLEHGTGAINVDACRYKDGDSAWPGPGHEFDLPERVVLSPNNENTFAAGMGSVRHPASSAQGRWPANVYHCPKPSTREKEAGLEEAQAERSGVGALRDSGRGKDAANVHPTVKPVRLMRWLVRLVTPPGGVVLDTFLGSGTTLVAAEREGFRGIGIEREPRYVDIAIARLRAVVEKP